MRNSKLLAWAWTRWSLSTLSDRLHSLMDAHPAPSALDVSVRNEALGVSLMDRMDYMESADGESAAKHSPGPNNDDCPQAGCWMLDLIKEKMLKISCGFSKHMKHRVKPRVFLEKDNDKVNIKKLQIAISKGQDTVYTESQNVVPISNLCAKWLGSSSGKASV